MIEHMGVELLLMARRDELPRTMRLARLYRRPSPSNRPRYRFPIFKDPRLVAGGPQISDIIKCRLKPIDPSDYAVTFTSEERARLHAIFPHGVCDWSQPGVAQRPLKDTWLSFGPAGSGDGGANDDEIEDR
jgi:Tannase-like family of unknown function (DUF6351)